MIKIIRTATVPLSLNLLLEGQLHFLSRYYQIRAVSGKDAHLDKVAQREGVPVIPIEMHRSIHIIKDFIALIRLYVLFKKEQPFVVHSITPKAGLLSMVAARLAGVPVRIHTFTGLIFPYKKGMMFYLLKYMDQITCAMATHIIPEGNGVKMQLQQHRITRKQMDVLANGNVNGVNTTFFSPDSVAKQRQDLREEYAVSNSDCVFVFVGRLVADKGIVELVESFLKLTANYPNIQLLLVGPYETNLDPLPEFILQTIENHTKIIQVGFQEDIRPFLKMSDVLMLPSHREGFPNVILQAGAMGLPCIVTDIPGCNEVIQHGENGLIIKLNDKNELYLAMETLYKSSALRNRLGQSARPKVCQKYSNEIVWNAVLEFYKSCINEKEIR